jgi:hypothetical protein
MNDPAMHKPCDELTHGESTLRRIDPAMTNPAMNDLAMNQPCDELTHDELTLR